LARRPESRGELRDALNTKKKTTASKQKERERITGNKVRREGTEGPTLNGRGQRLVFALGGQGGGGKRTSSRRHRKPLQGRRWTMMKKPIRDIQIKPQKKKWEPMRGKEGRVKLSLGQGAVRKIPGPHFKGLRSAREGRQDNRTLASNTPNERSEI